jgi:hypothetical protein
MKDEEGKELLLPHARGSARRAGVSTEASEQIEAERGQTSHGSRLSQGPGAGRRTPGGRYTVW